MTAGRTAAALAVAVALLAVGATPAALAQTDGVVTVRRTYEVAAHNVAVPWLGWTCPTGHLLEQAGEEPDCDPTDQTQDGSIDLGGALFESGPRTADATSVRISIVDDAFGGGVVAGHVCVDHDQDNVCGYGYDQSVIFCGDSPDLRLRGGPWTIAVFVGGGVRAELWGCDVTEAPAATSGGLLTEDGGVYADFTVPTPEDG